MSPFNFKKTLLFRAIAYTVLTAFIGLVPEKPSFAQVTIMMPPPGQMIHITNHFEPPQMVGLKINLKDPFSFDFIMDQGEQPMDNDVMKQEFNKIVKYFLVSLAMPNKEMWVNLSPYESTRIIPEVFAQTEMGRDLLAQDYVLKQFTASLMYPEAGLGKEFWSKVYAQAQERFGTTQINVNTFNKVWIVADHADVYQKDDTAFLVKSHLKVMLEQDYMAIEKNKEMFGALQPASTDAAMDAKTKMASQVVREIIIPAIEKEVNEGKSFAAVRQVYNAEIMATWFKKTLRESLLGQVFANKSKIAGQKNNDPQAMEKIYKQYLRAYKKGVFNYIKEDMAPDGQTIPRKYFSGGMMPETVAGVTNVTQAMLDENPSVRAEVTDFAQKTEGLTLKQRLKVAGVRLFMAVGAAAGLVAATNPAIAAPAPVSFLDHLNPVNWFHSNETPAAETAKPAAPTAADILQGVRNPADHTVNTGLTLGQRLFGGIITNSKEGIWHAAAATLNQDEADLAARQHENAVLDQQAKELDRQLKAGNLDLETALRQVHGLLARVRVLGNQHVADGKTIQTLKELARTLQAQADQNATDRDAARRDVATLNLKIQDLQRQLSASEAARQSLTTKLGEAERALTAANAQHTTDVETIKQNNTKIVQLTQAVSDLTDSLRKHDILWALALAGALLTIGVLVYKLRGETKKAKDAEALRAQAVANQNNVAANPASPEAAAAVNADNVVAQEEGKAAVADMAEAENLAAVNDARKIVSGEVPAEQVTPSVNEAAGSLVDAERAEADAANEVIDAENAVIESAFPQANGGVETALVDDETYQTLKANEVAAETDDARQEAKQARRDHVVQKARQIVQQAETPEAGALDQRLTTADTQEEETVAAKQEAVAAFNTARAAAEIKAAEVTVPEVAPSDEAAVKYAEAIAAADQKAAETKKAEADAQKAHNQAEDDILTFVEGNKWFWQRWALPSKEIRQAKQALAQAQSNEQAALRELAEANKSGDPTKSTPAKAKYADMQSKVKTAENTLRVFRIGEAVLALDNARDKKKVAELKKQRADARNALDTASNAYRAAKSARTALDTKDIVAEEAAAEAAVEEAPARAENNVPSATEQLAAVQAELRIARGNLENATNSTERKAPAVVKHWQEEVDRLVAQEAELAGSIAPFVQNVRDTKAALDAAKAVRDNTPVPEEHGDIKGIEQRASAEEAVRLAEANHVHALAAQEAALAALKQTADDLNSRVEGARADLSAAEEARDNTPVPTEHGDIQGIERRAAAETKARDLGVALRDLEAAAGQANEALRKAVELTTPVVPQTSADAAAELTEANAVLGDDRAALEDAPLPASAADAQGIQQIVAAEDRVAADEQALAGATTAAVNAGVEVNVPEPAFSVREGLAQFNSTEKQLSSLPVRIQAAKANVESARIAAKSRKQGLYESHDAWHAAVVELEAALAKAHAEVAKANAESSELTQKRHALAVKIVQNFDAQSLRVHQDIQAINDRLQASASAKARLAAAHQSLDQYSTAGKVNVEAEQAVEQEIRDAEASVRNNNIDPTEAQERLGALAREQRSNGRIRSGINALRAAYTDKATSAVAVHHDDKVGGINLSDENLTMSIKVDGKGMPLPAQFQDRAMMNISGLTSVIKTITPLTPQNVPALYDLLK